MSERQSDARDRGKESSKISLGKQDHSTSGDAGSTRTNPKEPPPPREEHNRRLFVLSLAALGVVYGDIGTSPLYALRECFHGEYGIAPSPERVLGVLSLMVWALVIVVSIKYLVFILKADNHGEGGVIALTALVLSQKRGKQGRRLALVGLGLFAASLLYGDGMITPAISILSAMEGLKTITPAFASYVIPATLAVLVSLFLFQRRGTAGVGALFGPIMLVWFGTIAVLGLRGIVAEPRVLEAINPWFGARFLLQDRLRGFLVLGAVFLVVTGAEALYADMGHFGRKPIRLTWVALVLPSLLCSYFGQGALLLSHPEAASQPFFTLVPQVLLVPMVILAAMATVIASQAVISGAFSLTRQAIQLGYLPRLKVQHTSATKIGQIFMPQVNWVLMAATIAIVLGFRTSSRLAAAYGVAVTTTMLATSLLFYFVARHNWRWGRLAAGLPVTVFLVVDVAFFGANLIKIEHGAWLPLVIGAGAFLLMTTWRKGRKLLARRLAPRVVSVDAFLREIAKEPPVRVPGKAVFLTGNPDTVPFALLDNLRHNKIVHRQVMILTVTAEDIPRVAREEKVEVRDRGNGIHQVVASFGFMEEPNVPYVLALAREKGLDFDLDEASFFVGRERILPGRRAGMNPVRTRVFGFLSLNEQPATAFFHLPSGQVIEVGEVVEI